ncbi:hypothetical protein R3W88_031912 [Solanum pinnatisectum]|uniref:Uncharacterized protein n=1 Tax=Solanum pinnatisectum TaxID=50273 RepID=A0AAV9LRC0_9SOLN|nr:hypothetical protein R3W88_031912 [Solanum pinnatisectum]
MVYVKQGIDIPLHPISLYRMNIHHHLLHHHSSRVQNHAMDLSLAGGQDALFLNVDATNGTIQCTQLSRQISREELDNLCLESIFDFFGNDLDWIRELNHDGHGHIPWDIDCDCPKFRDDYYGSKDDYEVDDDEYSYD